MKKKQTEHWVFSLVSDDIILGKKQKMLYNFSAAKYEKKTNSIGNWSTCTKQLLSIKSVC